MTIAPISGKTGFLYWTFADPFCIPIYSWNFSQTNFRPTYITSRTNNNPIRSPGVIEGRLTITGASATGIDLNQFFGELLLNPTNEFIAGWHDIFNSVDRYYKVVGMLSELLVNYNYTQSSEPGFTWSATFTNTKVTTLTSDASIFLTIDEPVICFMPPCTFPIRTSDLSHNAGIIKHVRSATLTEIYNLPNYRTSRQSPVITQSVIDRIVSLVIDGNFDYWFDMMQTDEGSALNPRDYEFYYGPGITDFFPLERGVLNSIDNLQVDVRTGALISATINLGVAG